MKVEVVIEAKNMRGDINGPFVSSRIRTILDIDREDPTKAISELILAAEKAVRAIGDKG